MRFWKFDSNIQIRLMLQFLTTMASMTVTPYLIVFFSKQLGTVVTGFMFLGVMAASVAGSFAGGYVADRIGRKKVIVVCEAVIFLSFLGVAFANSPWLQLPYVTFFFLFLFHNFSLGASGPAYQAFIIDVSHPENRRAIFTVSYWLNNLAVALGGLVGAFLFDEHYFALFLGVAVSIAISLAITILFIKETYVPEKHACSASRKQRQKDSSFMTDVMGAYKEVLKHRIFLLFTIANLFIIAVEEQLTNVIGLRLGKEIPEPEQLFSFLAIQVDGMNLLGLLKTENTLLVVCLTVLVSYVVKSLRDRTVLLSGLILYFCGYAWISYSSSPSVLLIAMFFATLGEVMHIPVKQALLANMVLDHARSTHMAVHSLFSIVGVSSAGVFILASAWVPNVVITGMFVGMGLICLVLFHRITKKVGQEQETVTKATPSNATA
ncbi:arabinose ABC transporter permease [Brevibacillus formosus]|uniref:Arabinose ABC transporter permease n=1 Tax=Brevibacillus formosus TaxID=54913 RepID=A0A220MKS4_9BACL|nr:MFS transporter [Brevibacillus formosus]ASJ55180.1 arabinose ABC transporter permease [Brevibacillus formosus]